MRRLPNFIFPCQIVMKSLLQVYRFVRKGIIDKTIFAANLDEAVRLFVANFGLSISIALIIDGKGKYKIRFLKGARCVFSCDCITRTEDWHIREVEF